MKKISEQLDEIAKEVALPLLVAAVIIPGGLVFVGVCIAAKKIYQNKKKKEEKDDRSENSRG